MRTTPMVEQGMTLIELLISLVILAIIIGMAAPSFVAMINSNRVTAATNDLVSSFGLARAEAIKRNGAVLILKNNTAGSRACAAADWACGHQIGVDLNSDGDLADTVGGVVELMRNVKAPHVSVEIDSEDAPLSEISYIANGGVLDRTEFTFDTSNCVAGDVRKVRKIILSLSGGSSLTSTKTASCP